MDLLARTRVTLVERERDLHSWTGDAPAMTHVCAKTFQACALWSSRKEECARRLRLLLAAAPEEPGTSSSGKRSRRPEALRFRFWFSLVRHCGGEWALGTAERRQWRLRMRPAPSSLSAP